jgi:hypothetical protein
MNATDPIVPQSFEKMLESFLDSLGHDPLAAKGSAGFEFGSGDFTVRVFSDSFVPERIVVEVDVRKLDELEITNATLLLMLHRLNEAARPVHLWSATIDENDLLLLSIGLPLVSVDAVRLQELVSDALERAESLAELVRQFSSKPPEMPAEGTEAEGNFKAFDLQDRA